MTVYAAGETADIDAPAVELVAAGVGGVVAVSTGAVARGGAGAVTGSDAAGVAAAAVAAEGTDVDAVTRIAVAGLGADAGVVTRIAAIAGAGVDAIDFAGAADEFFKGALNAGTDGVVLAGWDCAGTGGRRTAVGGEGDTLSIDQETAGT